MAYRTAAALFSSPNSGAQIQAKCQEVAFRDGPWPGRMFFSLVRSGIVFFVPILVCFVPVVFPFPGMVFSVPAGVLCSRSFLLPLVGCFLWPPRCFLFPATPSRCFSPDSEAMGFLLQITMSCPCALSRQVAGAGAGCWCWCCELAGAVSWLCAWWRQGAGRWCCELAVHVVETGCGCCVPGACCELAGDRVPVLGGCWVPVLVLVL